MHRMLIVVTLTSLAACPRPQPTATAATDAAVASSLPRPTPAPAEVDDGALVLVEAELASRLQRGQIAAEEYCEADVPRLVLKGGTLEVECGQRRERLTIEADRTVGGRRVLAIKGDQQVVLEDQGRQRYRVSGSPCDKRPTVYVVFPEARSFRDRWLKSATCPTEDMKMAR